MPARLKDGSWRVCRAPGCQMVAWKGRYCHEHDRQYRATPDWSEGNPDLADHLEQLGWDGLVEWVDARMADRIAYLELRVGKLSV